MSAFESILPQRLLCRHRPTNFRLKALACAAFISDGFGNLAHRMRRHFTEHRQPEIAFLTAIDVCCTVLYRTRRLGAFGSVTFYEDRNGGQPVGQHHLLHFLVALERTALLADRMK